MCCHHITDHQLIVERSIPHKKHSKETGQSHDSQTADLYQHDNDEQPLGRECRRNIDRNQPRDTSGTGSGKQSIDKRNTMISGTRKHQ